MVPNIDISEYENKILELQKIINTYKPLSHQQLSNLRNWFNIGFTTHSNAIEWNSYTLSEVKVLIEDGITVWGKTLRETQETQNLAALTRKIWDFLESDFTLDESFLLTLHTHLLKDIENESVWVYRNTQVYISGSEDIPPKSSQIQKLMDEFIVFCNTKDTNTLKKISDIHFRFVKIHPFFDGNGRIWRLLMNLYLVKYGYFPIIFPVITRSEYIASLWKNKTAEDFYAYFLWQMYENMSDYLRFLED